MDSMYAKKQWTLLKKYSKLILQVSNNRGWESTVEKYGIFLNERSGYAASSAGLPCCWERVPDVESDEVCFLLKRRMSFWIVFQFMYNAPVARIHSKMMSSFDIIKSKFYSKEAVWKNRHLAESANAANDWKNAEVISESKLDEVAFLCEDQYVMRVNQRDADFDCTKCTESSSHHTQYRPCCIK